MLDQVIYSYPELKRLFENVFPNKFLLTPPFIFISTQPLKSEYENYIEFIRIGILILFIDLQ